MGWRPGLLSGLRWGSLQQSPRPSSWTKGGGKGRGKHGERGGEGKAKRGRGEEEGTGVASQQLELPDPPVIIYYSFIMKSYTIK